MSRRHSVVDAYSKVETKIRETMSELSKLWDEVDMKDSMRLKRVDNAFTHITQLCDDMLDGEQEMVRDLKVSIKEDLANVQKMRSELEMDEYKRPNDVRENSIALMRHLQMEIKKLEEQFNRRHEDQKVLVEKLLILKQRLDSDFQFDHDPDALFPMVSYKQYESDCSEMEDCLRARYNKMEHLQTEMKHWRTLSDDVAKHAKNNEDLIDVLSCNIDAEDFVFSEKALEKFESYHEELKPLYINWLEQIEFVWLEKYESISYYWNKCHVPLNERRFQAKFEPGRHSTASLEQMTEECERLKKKYEASKAVFELVEKWKEAWYEKLAIEDKRRMPDYYKKVNVLPDNKRERELLTIMPNIEKHIRIANKKYQEENDGDTVTIQGKSPNEYLADIQEEHKQELKFELQQKKEEKTRLQSPQPCKTPRTQKRNQPFFRTPKSTARLEPAAKRLNFDMDLPACVSPATSEAISFITPTRRHLAGPKTSSPKESSPTRTTTPFSRRAMTPSSATSSSKLPLARKNF